MKHELEVDAENQWILVRYHGVLEESDPLALLERAVTMPGWSDKCDRIVVYGDDADLHKLDVAAFGRIRDQLAGFVDKYYGVTQTRSAQVCNDRMKQVLLDFWMGLAGPDYPSQLQRFDTVEEAKAWLRRDRENRDDHQA